jgi:uncharacterized membrane protein (Fun14 family)
MMGTLRTTIAANVVGVRVTPLVLVAQRKNAGAVTINAKRLNNLESD